MAGVPTEHLQLQKIREKATEILAKLDGLKVDVLRIGRVYVENLRTLRNADFEEWIDDNHLLGWMQSDYTGDIVKRTPGAVYGGVACVEFKPTYCSISQLLELPIKGNFVEKLSIVGVGFHDSAKIKFLVLYSDGTKDSHIFDLLQLEATECDMTPYIDTSKHICGIEIENYASVPPFPPTYYGCYLDRAILTISELAKEETLEALKNLTDKSFKTAPISCNSFGDNEIISAVPGKVIKIYNIVLNVAGAVSCTWRSATNDLTGSMPFDVREGYVTSVNPPAFVLKTAQGEALNLKLSAEIHVYGWVSYWDDDES